MTSQWRKLEVDGTEYRVIYGNAADLVEHPDGSTETVYDLDTWLSERTPTTDGGSQPFDGSVCPMCGQPYDSYTSHLQHCQPR